MNLLLKALGAVCLATSSLSAQSLPELKILNLENIIHQADDIAVINEHIKQQDPDIVCIFKNLFHLIQNTYEAHFNADFPFAYNDEQNTCIILSKYELSHVKVNSFNPNNTMIEMASSNLPSMILNAHLPDFSTDQIETLKSYLTATSPYMSLYLTGDLADNKYLQKQHEYLVLPCSKKELEFSVEGNKKGEAEVKVDARISSDDKCKNLEVEAKYSQDRKGESNASAKASFKIEF
jgi:hypothetical protein